MHVNVGDILGDRDSRRKGRKVEVIWVDPKGTHVTVKTIRDADDAVKSSIGNTTDVKMERLAKAYDTVVFNVQSPALDTVTVHLDGVGLKDAVFSSEAYMYNKYDYVFPEDEETFPEDFMAPEPMDLLSEDEWLEANGFTSTDDEVVEDTNVLEGALNSVGYHFVPDLEDLQEQLDGYLYSLSKKDIVELVHRTITEL